MTIEALSNQSTASLAQPPLDALDMGAAWEVADDELSDEDAALQLLAELLAEREVRGLEVSAERNGIAWFELPGAGRVAVKECEQPHRCAQKLHYFAQEGRHPDDLRWATRQRVVGLIAAHKREVEA